MSREELSAGIRNLWKNTNADEPGGLFKWVSTDSSKPASNLRLLTTVNQAKLSPNATVAITPRLSIFDVDHAPINVTASASGIDLNDHGALHPTFKWEISFSRNTPAFSGVFRCWLCFYVMDSQLHNILDWGAGWEVNLDSSTLRLIGLPVVRYLVPQGSYARSVVTLMVDQAIRLLESGKPIITFTIKPHFNAADDNITTLFESKLETNRGTVIIKDF